MTWHTVCLHSTCKRDQVRLGNFTLQCSYRPTYIVIADILVTVILHVQFPQHLAIHYIELQTNNYIKMDSALRELLMIHYIEIHSALRELQTNNYIEMDSALRELPTINYIEYC